MFRTIASTSLRSLRLGPAASIRRRRFASVADHGAGVQSGTIAINKTAGEIASRAACVQLFLTRWGIEGAVKDSEKEKDPRVQQSFEAVSRTLEETPIGKLLTKQEQTALSLPLGAWSSSPQIEPRWESFGILLWSLGIVSHIPEYHSSYPREILFKATGIIPAHPSTITNFTQHFSSQTTTTLIPTSSFIHEVNRAEAWYWRSKAQVLVDLQSFLKGDGPDVDQAKKKLPAPLRKSLETLPTALSQASLRAHKDGLIQSRVKEDFGVGDVSYADLGHHDLGLVASIAQDRLAALGWLAGVREWDVGEDEEVPFVNPLGSLWTPKDE